MKSMSINDLDLSLCFKLKLINFHLMKVFCLYIKLFIKKVRRNYKFKMERIIIEGHDCFDSNLDLNQAMILWIAKK